LRLSRRGIIALSILLGLIVLAFSFRTRILWAMGAMLVNSEAPRKADIVVVLAGDANFGGRILKGAELVREGFAPKLFVSNGRAFYGLEESEAAADFAVRHGYDRSSMILFHKHPASTEIESRLILPLLRDMGVHSILLVTSDYHTARAARIFQKNANGIDIHPVAAPEPDFCGGYWWTSRECRKTWFFEELKTVTGPFGI
jgi:uncharacterized SAM-binding protein YcdF (DUF218 family)